MNLVAQSHKVEGRLAHATWQPVIGLEIDVVHTTRPRTFLCCTAEYGGGSTLWLRATRWRDGSFT